MSEEDDRTLWCGNLADKVTEELLYELFLQAGPVEMVKIPRDNDKKPRSYAFITYAHAVSVDYAINIYNGTRLFNRSLSLSKKSRNSSNAGSPKVNNNNSPQQNRGQSQQHQHQFQGNDGNIPNMGQVSFAGMSPMAMMGLINQMNSQALMSMGDMKQNALQNKMNRNNDRPYQQNQQKPYSRERDRGDRDRGDNHSRHRNENPMFSRARCNDRGNNGGGGNQRRNDYRNRR